MNSKMLLVILSFGLTPTLAKAGEVHKERKYQGSIYFRFEHRDAHDFLHCGDDLLIVDIGQALSRKRPVRSNPARYSAAVTSYARQNPGHSHTGTRHPVWQRPEIRDLPYTQNGY